MALHDVAMYSFGQWWKRQIRGGYGAMDVADRFGQHAFKTQVRSARVWGIAWPVALIAGAVLVFFLRWKIGLPIFVAVAAALPLQALRVANGARKRGVPSGLALAYGALMMVAKWASLVGQFRYWRDRRAGLKTRLIEHKGPVPDGNQVVRV
jgi:hypothetical protein